MKTRFAIGNVISFATMVMLWSACSEPFWALDAVNSVDIGLWFLGGIGVRYKLINAGLPADSALVSSSSTQSSTTYGTFCAIADVGATDPWCQSDAMATRVLVVLALMAAIVGFIFSVMSTLGVKTPTWDGEGRETTLVTPVVCSFLHLVCLLPAVILWQRVVQASDALCVEALQIEDFVCISSNSSHTVAIVNVMARCMNAMNSIDCYHDRTMVTTSPILLGGVDFDQGAQCKGAIADVFTLAAKTDNIDDILSGIANKIDIDALGSDGRNALHWACTLHRTSICHILLKKGASISMKDRDGWTPLHWSSRVGGLDIVRLLAKYGADVNVKDRWGTSPLMLTVVGENRAAAETLIELGANINARNIFGQTALMLCIESGKHLHQLGMLLIDAGSDLTLRDMEGMTALHYAAAYGHSSLFASIIKLCDVELVDGKNKYGETLEAIAQLREQPQIESLLADWRSGRPISIERSDNASGDDSGDTEDSDDTDSDGE